MNLIPKMLPADVVSPQDMLGDLIAYVAPYLIVALVVLLLIAAIVAVIIVANKRKAEIEAINKNAELAKQNRLNNEVIPEKGDGKSVDDGNDDSSCNR